jgi:hypothetical protein
MTFPKALFKLGHDTPGLIDEPVPSFAAKVDDVVVGGEDPVGQPVVA